MSTTTDTETMTETTTETSQETFGNKDHDDTIIWTSVAVLSIAFLGLVGVMIAHSIHPNSTGTESTGTIKVDL